MNRITTCLIGTDKTAQALLRPVTLAFGRTFNANGQELKASLLQKICAIAFAILLLPLSLPSVLLGLILVNRSVTHKQAFNHLLAQKASLIQNWWREHKAPPLPSQDPLSPTSSTPPLTEELLPGPPQVVIKEEPVTESLPQPPAGEEESPAKVETTAQKTPPSPFLARVKLDIGGFTQTAIGHIIPPFISKILPL